MSLFRTRKSTGGAKNTSPALLFRDLKRPQSEIKWLWGHQEKLLDRYHEKHLKTSDLAIELPTGSGKTMVGLLIAEYRRRTFGERVVYLCPTKQLCHQVNNVAKREGMEASLLIGRQKDYDQVAFSSYQRAKAIAITTYSGVFNTNPAIDDPETILCDDAHAADNYIASLWSLKIYRKEYDGLYKALVDTFGDAVSSDMRRRIQSFGGFDGPLDVDLLPLPKYVERLDDISDVIDTHVAGTSLRYAWELLAGHLDACCIYMSRSVILIRPLVPPTHCHAPFSGAKQRIFMSATLGEGGELERMTGIPKISRLPLPKGWEARSTGRRLILFPNLLSTKSPNEATKHLINSNERTLILLQDNKQLKRFVESCEGKDIKVFTPSDVEESLSEFTQNVGSTVLVFANRYDGIDLPGDSCRRLILSGLPGGTDLHEQFLMRRLGAHSQFRGRIRTRITQGIGRCTRDENDFALVLLFGEDLLKWCSTRINIQGMNPELQAEINFGLDNSADRTIDEYTQLCGAFFAQNEDWNDADNSIIELRDETEQEKDSVTDALELSARSELDYNKAIWRSDHETAYHKACEAIEALSGGIELRPYRGFWHYLAACSAFEANRRNPSTEWVACFKDHVARARSAIIGVTWLSMLDIEKETGGASAEPSIHIPVVVKLLENWGLVGKKFSMRIAETRKGLECKDSGKKFEAALLILGTMLGCLASNSDEKGAPDGLWEFVDGSGIVFEAKSEEQSDGVISLGKVRQALTHEDWLRQHEKVPADMKLKTVFATYQDSIESSAQKCAADLRYVNIKGVISLFERVSKTLTEIRNQARNLSEEAMSELIDKRYRDAKLTHKAVAAALTEARLSELQIR